MRKSIALFVAALIVLAGVFISVETNQINAGGGEVVFAALEVLKQEYIEPVDSLQLINGALAGLAAKLKEAGCLKVSVTYVPLNTDPAAHFAAMMRNAVASCPKLTRLEMEFASTAAMLDTLNDGHTTFLPPRQKQNWLSLFQGRPYVGIGVQFKSRNRQAYIFGVIPGSPAEKAGLKRFDRILRIDGQVIDGLEDREAERKVIELIAGPAGSTVRLTIARPGIKAPFDVSVTRRVFRVPAVDRPVVMNGGIGYIRARIYSRGSARQFYNALYALAQRRDLKGLVLDFRYHGGGLSDEMQWTVSMLLPPDLPIATVIERGGLSQTFYTLRKNGYPLLPASLPLVILIDDNTASNAEVTAAAIIEHKRGVAVGTRTAGLVGLAVFSDLPSGAGMMFTRWRMMTGKGAYLDKRGVIPTYRIEFSASDIKQGRDPQLEFALELLRNATR